MTSQVLSNVMEVQVFSNVMGKGILRGHSWKQTVLLKRTQEICSIQSQQTGRHAGTPINGGIVWTRGCRNTMVEDNRKMDAREGTYTIRK